MFSKAGKRIVKKLDSVDPRIEVAAAGCFLFVNSDGNFEQQAGSSPDQSHVNQVGWSYGGQWADFNTDGQLDLVLQFDISELREIVGDVFERQLMTLRLAGWLRPELGHLQILGEDVVVTISNERP